MKMANAQKWLIYPAALIALAACAAWTLMDLVEYGANAGDLMTLAVLILGIVALYLSNRQKFLAPTPASSGADQRVREDWEPPEFEEVAYVTPEARAHAQAELSVERSRFVRDRVQGEWPPEAEQEARPSLATVYPPAEKECRNGDYLTFIPAAAKVIDFEQRVDGSRWVVYQMPTDYNGANRKSPMTLAPQRAVADVPAVRAEFDSPEAAGLVVEEVGDEDDGFTPFGEDQGPGVIGDEGALALLDEGKMGDPAYRRAKIDKARRKRHSAHWLAEAERTGKLQGAAGAYLQHLLAGTEAVPTAAYLAHAKQLAQQASPSPLLLTAAKLDTPLGHALVAAQKTAGEGATLALALIEEVQRLEEQRDELACRLIQAMPTAIDRKRENAYRESQGEVTETVLDGEHEQLVRYTLTENDMLLAAPLARFTPEQKAVGAEHLVPLSDVAQAGARQLRIIDPVHGVVIGFIHKTQLESVPD